MTLADDTLATVPKSGSPPWAMFRGVCQALHLKRELLTHDNETPKSRNIPLVTPPAHFEHRGKLGFTSVG